MKFYTNSSISEVEYHELEFTTWHSDKENLNVACTELDNTIRIQAVLEPGTTIKTGLYFQHKLKLFSNKGIIIECVAEHVFISPEIFRYSFSQIKELVETAHLRFKDKLFERSAAAEIPFTLDCVVNDFEVEQVIQQLK